MSKSKKFSLAAFAVFVALAITGCDRSDLISGAGNTIIDDLDSTLHSGLITRTFFLNDSAFNNPTWNMVGGWGSLPVGADPAFSTHIAVGHLKIGVSDDGDTAIAHAQFRVRPFSADTTREPLYDNDFTPFAAHMYFRASDSLTPRSTKANVFLSDTLTWGRAAADSLTIINTVPVDRANVSSWDCADESGAGRMSDDIPDIEKIPCEVQIGRDWDSVRLPQDVARAIFEKRLDGGDPEIPDYFFAISIVDFEEEIFRIREPYVVLSVRRIGHEDDTTHIRRDTIRIHLTRYTVLENESEVTLTNEDGESETVTMAEARSRVPYSSQLTKRVAWFEIKIDTIASIYNNREFEILNAQLAIVARKKDDNEDGIASIGYDVMFAAVAHDSLITNEFAVAGAADESNTLPWLFGIPPSRSGRLVSRVNWPFNLLNIKMPLMRRLDNRANTIHIHIRPTTENSTILWDRPEKIDAAFVRARGN